MEEQLKVEKEEKKQTAQLFVTYYMSPIGLIEIKSTAKSISSIMFVEEKQDETTLVTRLLDSCARQLNEYFEGKRKKFDFPINQNGTPFQLKTWDYINQIPFGKTKTYLNLSREHWNRNATRAVGNAVGKNKLSIVVPCHRVVGTNGDLTGYSGGLWRKEWLLKHEEKITFGMKELFD